MRRIIALLLFCTAITTILPAQVLQTLRSFDGADGRDPTAPLVEGIDGNLYGTTSLGGDGQGLGNGTVFKITPQGALSTLHRFEGSDGLSPNAGMVQGMDGNLYGTTNQGGSDFDGTVFQMTDDGVLSTIYSFGFADGYQPLAGVVQAKDGLLYGTTTGGGSNQNGTVFKTTLSGMLTTLHSFLHWDGAQPSSSLVQGTDGNFYGTTPYGGAWDSGTVFKMTPQADLTVLYGFSYEGTEGKYPYTGLVQASDGNFYGTTLEGGAYYCGTVFRITPSGTLTDIHDFNCKDGWSPNGLIQALDGNLYGTTFYGGTVQPCVSCGTIFKMNLDGKLTTLYSFGRQDGAYPAASLFESENGLLYGTTSAGGTNDDGTVFRFVVSAILSVTKYGTGTVTGLDGHIYCGSVCSYRYSGGAQVTLSAVPAPGYTFTGWTGCDNSNGSYCSVTMTSAKNVTGTFTAANVTLTSLTFKPRYVRGGQLSAGTLTLSGPAPPAGVTVGLSSDHPSVAHPPSLVIVPGGKSSVIFGVNTFPVKSNTTVTITATAGASQVSGTLTVGTTLLPPSIN